MDCDVLVIGAGVSGLTAAFHLSRAGLRVEVIEAASRSGGVIGSEANGGFVYERGPNSMLDNAVAVRELIDALGIASERVEVSAAAKNRFIVRSGKLVPVPLSPGGLIATPLFSVRAKLRLLKEPFVTPTPEARESVSEFTTRRAGREFLDYAVEPFVAGIYAGDPDELSVEAAFPRLHALEAHGGLFRGRIRSAEQQGRSRRVPTSFSFRHGMRTLTDALAHAVEPVRLNTHATRIARGDDGSIAVTLDRAEGPALKRSAAVVLAVPADVAATLVRSFEPESAEALEAIPYAPVASVALGYARGDIGHALDGFGFLVPRVERQHILGCLFSSSMFPGRAPQDHVLLTVYIGGRRNPELLSRSDEELRDIAHAALEHTLAAREPPRFSAVTRWPRGIPQYTLGHVERVSRAGRVEKAMAGLFLSGSYRGGVSVADCIQSAQHTAELVRAYVNALRC